MALKLEGITRNTGKHAGGVVIAPGKNYRLLSSVVRSRWYQPCSTI
ncbi:hypothetical protein ABFY41_00745 [Acinetobacter haemolyticus]